jgi:ferric-dicitrate binding protein FerR (iron transport regulator)
VLQEVSRYTNAQFELADPQLASINIGGYFPAGDIDRLLIDLEETFQIRAHRTGTRILLEAY